ncbi:MAG: outer-membrane lipoprotein carrier protein LolA [Candidatus Kapabacteria bacterium]|nr:outer-membrane lipoprotein carrier protein LolA [Candidatus Kapabacteria bacterium]
MIRILILCVAVLTATTARAQDDAASLHGAIAKQLSSATALQAEVITAQAGGTVIISAKRSNKYVIDAPSRSIICNGKDVWNLDKVKRTVVVSNYKAGGLSIEKLFMDVIAQYKPVALKTVNNSTLGAMYSLQLEPGGAPLFGVKAITLGIDKKTKAIRSISVQSDQGKQEWTVRSLKTNMQLSDAVFTYTARKGVEEIDMRD